MNFVSMIRNGYKLYEDGFYRKKNVFSNNPSDIVRFIVRDSKGKFVRTEFTPKAIKSTLERSLSLN